MILYQTLPDKIGFANTLALYLDGTDFDLSVELAERDAAWLAGDYDFRRVLDERLGRCERCNSWVATDAYCGCQNGDWDGDE